jgi:EthD domain
MPHEIPIKLTFCLRKRPDWTQENFYDYWLNSHGPLVHSFAEALGTWKYSQLHNLNTAMGDALAVVRGAPEAYDGIAEMWWRSRAEMETASASKAGRHAGRILLEDEKKFIDLSRSPVWLNQVHDIVVED